LITVTGVLVTGNADEIIFLLFQGFAFGNVFDRKQDQPVADRAVLQLAGVDQEIFVSERGPFMGQFEIFDRLAASQYLVQQFTQLRQIKEAAADFGDDSVQAACLSQSE
jgi:hypothetical protein